MGQPLHLGEIAQVLGWSVDRVRASVAVLATKMRVGTGIHVHETGDTVALEIEFSVLDAATQHRLNQLLHARGRGPGLRVLHLAHTLINDGGRSPWWLSQFPDLLDDANAYGLITQQTTTGPDGGTRLELHLHPDVWYALGMTDDLPPPDVAATGRQHGQDWATHSRSPRCCLTAVVGVERATRLIRDGQRIRVQGTDGFVELMP